MLFRVNTVKIDKGSWFYVNIYSDTFDLLIHFIAFLFDLYSWL